VNHVNEQVLNFSHLHARCACCVMCTRRVLFVFAFASSPCPIPPHHLPSPPIIRLATTSATRCVRCLLCELAVYTALLMCPCVVAVCAPFPASSPLVTPVACPLRAVNCAAAAHFLRSLCAVCPLRLAVCLLCSLYTPLAACALAVFAVCSSLRLQSSPLLRRRPAPRAYPTTALAVAVRRCCVCSCLLAVCSVEHAVLALCSRCAHCVLTVCSLCARRVLTVCMCVRTCCLAVRTRSVHALRWLCDLPCAPLIPHPHIHHHT
jgi:hypothetical protein